MKPDPGPDAVGCALAVVILAIIVACVFAWEGCRGLS